MTSPPVLAYLAKKPRPTLPMSLREGESVHITLPSGHVITITADVVNAIEHQGAGKSAVTNRRLWTNPHIGE